MAGAFDREGFPTAPKETPVPKEIPSTGGGSGNDFVRDRAYEKQLIAGNSGFTQEYFDSRGGVNREGYYGDVPSYERLTAAEYKTVTNKNGTVNTAAQAALYQQKRYDFYVSQGMTAAEAAGKASSGFGTYAITFKDAEGNAVTPVGGDFGRGGSAENGDQGASFSGLDSNNEPTFTYGSNGEAMTAQQYTERQDIMDVMRAKFKDLGLESLIPTIEKLAMEGATESTITLALRESDAYKQRFAANEDRKKSGLAVLDPGTYLKLEDGYRQTLRSYGLTQFDNDSYVQQFIAKDVSPTELSNRVAAAVQRVQMASPEVMKTLTDYYKIPQGDLVAYILDPKQQYLNIDRKISAAEIGVQASRQGLQSDVNVSEALAAQGVTAEQAQKGYSTIAELLPNAQKLSAIYGGTTEQYGQTEAEQEAFNSLASAQRKRQKLASLEVGTFSGQSGTSKGAFSSGYLNKQSSAGQF
jgi:hypothetical protein